MQTRFLGQVAYLPTFEAMKAHTAERFAASRVKTAQNTPLIDLQPHEYGCNQLWICEHLPVFTQGLAGKVEHVLNPGSIPVVQTDRGGQVTFHGPGQVVAYPLMDLKAAGLAKGARGNKMNELMARMRVQSAILRADHQL